MVTAVLHYSYWVVNPPLVFVVLLLNLLTSLNHRFVRSGVLVLVKLSTMPD